MTKAHFVSKNEKQLAGTKWFEILVILTIALTALTGGILLCWPSPFMIKIVNDKENYDITEEEASYFAVISTVGVIVLPPIFAPLINHFGRKRFLLFTSVPYITSYMIKAFARNIWLFYFARFLNGLGDSINYACLIPYMGEIASPEIRGVWGITIVLNGFFGQFVINILGIYCSIMLTSFICVTIPIIFFCIFIFMPESPYFYLQKGKDDEAEASLRRLRRRSNVENELKEIKVAVQQQLNDSGSWRELFMNRVHRRALLTAVFLRVSQILSGVFVFGSYTQFIFQKIGTNISPELSTIIYTFANFVLYSSAAYGSNKLGRRTSLISSLIGTSIIFICEAAYFLIDSFCSDINLKFMSWFPLAGLLAFLIFSSYGIGTVPFIMPGELFASSIKAKGMAVVISIVGLSNFTVNSIFYNFSVVAGLGGPFLLFGICNIISAIITYKYVPETKNKTLREIQELLCSM